MCTQICADFVREQQSDSKECWKHLQDSRDENLGWHLWRSPEDGEAEVRWERSRCGPQRLQPSGGSLVLGI